ncbi:MAG: C40 family peptidase, partial [Lachnospiraceae bacterium]
LYPGYAAKIAGPVGEWTAVKSGTVTGYVKTEYILTGMEAEKKAQEVVAQVTEETQEAEKFTYAESREEEEIRLAEEARIAAEEAEKEAARLAEEAATKQGSGQAIVDYACQFIGNPYVWGGTSLTNGADCSGFIQSVYAHFGINMPRTSGEMRSAGFGVSYDEAIAGDVICYDGHVGIYMGNGEIVNARNPAKGIGISPATYKGIITVRRML